MPPLTRDVSGVRHLFVTQDFPPVRGGMARRHVELCRRIAGVRVSTVAHPDAARVDAAEPYPVHRQPFPFTRAKLFSNQLRWAHWLRSYAARDGVGVLHCGNLRPVGLPVLLASRRARAPYVLYVNGLDLLVERRKAARGAVPRWQSRQVFGGARGIVANSAFTGMLAADVMREVGVRTPPPIACIDLGTDPAYFHPGRDRRALRRRWGVGDRPVLLTVARLVRHKGQDSAIRALALLRDRAPDAHYVVVGEGADAERLRALAAELHVADRVVFAGALTDDEIAEAYATATLYVGLSRSEGTFEIEGFGISFIEAGASGTPAVAGRSGGIPSAVRDGETGVLVDPTDAAAAADAIAALLADDMRRTAMGAAARRAAETHFNWDRVAAETLAFVHRIAPDSDASSR